MVMKKNTRILLLLVAAFLMTGCVPRKNIVYFQGHEEVLRQGKEILQQYEMRLKPADQVLIKVTCQEPELLEIFAQDVVMGSKSTSGNLNVGGGGTMSNVYGYTLDNEGFLNLPAVGKVYVNNMTVDEAAATIEKAIMNTNDIKDPKVTVRLLNARVAVLGAVSRPSVVSLTSERNTVVDILAQCGDVDDTGLRKKIRLYREQDGQRKVYEMDLTSANIFDSPAYYVQQNDLIYVEPNKSKSIKTSAFYTFLGAGSSILGLIASVTSLVLVLSNKK